MTYKKGLLSCLWGIKSVYCNVKREPKNKPLYEILKEERQFSHLKNKSDYREVLEVFGLTDDQLRDLIDRYGKDFTKKFGWGSGRVRRLNKMIKTRQDEIEKHTKELQDLKGVFSPIIKSLNPTIQLKKPTKNFPYWKGRIWWNMGYNQNKGRFNTKGRRIDFHLCSEKERKEQNYSTDQLKEICLRKFRQRILHQDFGILSKK